MDNLQILLNKNKSKQSVNNNNSLTINFVGSEKLLPCDPFTASVSEMDVYNNERQNCNTIRLTVCVNPICSNVLFNNITEVVRNEGTDNVECLNFNSGLTFTNLKFKNDSSFKEEKRALNSIRDTQLNNNSNGFVYHCGIDIFNNHYLRSKTFKTVCPSEGNVVGDDPINQPFNTIADLMRSYNGKQIMGYDDKGEAMEDPKVKLHLYLADEITPYKDTINEKLIEENGWFGFTNVGKMKVYNDESTDPRNMDYDWFKVINNRKPCDFIDMYPTRDLFYFDPKYNPYRQRLEKNWHYFLSYPSSSITEGISFIKTHENGSTSLKVMLFDDTIKANNGTNAIKIWSVSKHGLSKNNIVNIYKGDNIEIRNAKVIDVVDDYTFYVYSNGVKLSNKWLNIDDMNQEDISSDRKTYKGTYYILNNEKCNIDDTAQDISFTRIVEYDEVEYYVRIFSKLPNWKFADKKINEKLLYKDDIDYIKTYQSVENEFDNTIGKIAFSKNIYNDNITEIVFTDDINIGSLKDNLGRPLTDIYFTIIKNNQGYKDWYGKNMLQQSNTTSLQDCNYECNSVNEELENNNSFTNTDILSFEMITDYTNSYCHFIINYQDFEANINPYSVTLTELGITSINRISFANNTAIKKITSIPNTSNVTNMSYMFYNCTNLTSIEFGNNFDTSNVTNMGYMFTYSSGLTSLDLSSFDTSKVTDMNFMFYGCTSLTSLDLSSFDTSKVTDMNFMFYGCTSLTSVNLSGLNFENLNDGLYMFSGCTNLTSVNLSGVHVSNTSCIQFMFQGCKKLTSLDLSNFNVSNETDMIGMFYGCENLSSIIMNNVDYTTFNKVKQELDFASLSNVKIITNMGYVEIINNNINEIIKNNPNIEYSHCFGKLSCAFKLSDESIPNLNYNNLSLINNIDNTFSRNGLDMSIINENRPEIYDYDEIQYNKYNMADRSTSISNSDIHYYGDLCCYSRVACDEQIIQDIGFRFNTAQRELTKEFTAKEYIKNIIYDEIQSDDYDDNGFKIKEYELNESVQRKEGYYYNPHYRIRIKSLSKEITEVYPKFLTPKSIELYNGNKTKLYTMENHELGNGDRMYIYDLSSNTKYECIVETVSNRRNLILNVELPDYSNKKRYKYFKVIDNLPSYANFMYDGSCRYVYREIIQNGYDNYTDIEQYPFTNGALYINKHINLFLRRQNPEGIYDIRSKTYPYDINTNNISFEKENNYYEEDNIEC